jgi:hypothetical protein
VSHPNKLLCCLAAKGTVLSRKAELAARSAAAPGSRVFFDWPTVIGSFGNNNLQYPFFRATRFFRAGSRYFESGGCFEGFAASLLGLALVPCRLGESVG